MKPCLFVAIINLGEIRDLAPIIATLSKLAAARGVPLVPILGDLEVELQDFPLEERGEFLQGLGPEELGIHRLVRESHRLLGLVTFDTVVGPEVRAWQVPAGTPAPKAAGRVHSETGFIRAEVMSFTDLARLGAAAKVREAGRLHSEGPDYVVRDGDILLFRFQL